MNKSARASLRAKINGTMQKRGRVLQWGNGAKGNEEIWPGMGGPGHPGIDFLSRRLPGIVLTVYLDRF